MASFRPPTVTRENWEAGNSASSDRDSADEHVTLLEGDEAHRRRIGLIRTIEGEVIPRLVLAHREAGEEAAVRDRTVPAPDEENVEELTRIVLTQDDDTAWAYVRAMQSQGIPAEDLFLDLLAPTARRLGDLWVADLCDFAEVTIGLGRLQLAMRNLSMSVRDQVDARQELGRRVLLAATPGEQHTFGILMVSEFMRRDGWDVTGEPGLSSEDLVDMAGREWFSVVGLSLHSERSIDVLTSCIRAIRRESKNRAIGIMVGGKVFMERPELAPLVGADATASDAPGATRQADNLLALLPMRC